MTQRFARVTIDDQGIRKASVLWFFGSPFDVAWSDIIGWATSEAGLAGGGGTEPMISRSVELHTAKKVYFLDPSGEDFTALVKELDRRLPGKRRESILLTMQRFRGMGQ